MPTRILAFLAIGVFLISSIAVSPVTGGVLPDKTNHSVSIPEVVPSVISSQLTTAVNSTYSVSINATTSFNNATVYFGDGTSQFVKGGTSATITVSHAYSYAGFYLIWYIINYTLSSSIGMNELIPVEVLDTQLSQNASLGMLTNSNGKFMMPPGSNVSNYIYYSNEPTSGFGLSGQNVYQVYDQYLAVEKAGSTGKYVPYYSKNMAYGFGSTTGTYQLPASNSYYNLSNIQSGFYMLRLSTATALVNSSTGSLSGIRHNTTEIWDFVVNESASTYYNYADQLFNSIEPSNGNFSLDPQLGYLNTQIEAIVNTMQYLVAPEGSNSSNFFPELASSLPTPGSGINTADVTRTISEYVNGQWTTGSVTYAPGQVYTFSLRSNATWQDGTQVTAWDAAFSLIRDLLFASGPNTPGYILAEYMLPGNFYQSGSYQNITNNITWDNTSDTLTLYLQRPVVDTLLFELISSPGASVIDASWAYSHGAGLSFTPPGFKKYMNESQPGQLNQYFFTHVMSDGPYSLSYLVPGNVAYFTPNPDYHPPAAASGKEWAPPATIDEIQIDYTSNSYGSLLAFESGWAQSVASSLLTPVDWQEVKSMTLANTATVNNAASLTLYWFNFNAKVDMSLLSQFDPNANLPYSIFTSLDARLAFAYAFNYAHYMSDQLNNKSSIATYGQAFAGMMPDGMIGSQSISDLNKTGVTSGVPYFDLTLAKNYWNDFLNSSVNMNVYHILPNGSFNGKPIEMPIVMPFSPPGAPLTQGQHSAIEGAASWSVNLSKIVFGSATPPKGGGFPLLNVSFLQTLYDAIINEDNPFPIWFLGWIPDYNYPIDYLGPMGLPMNGTTYPGANSFTTYWFNSTSNPGRNVTEANTLANMTNEYNQASSTTIESQQMVYFHQMNQNLVNMSFYVYGFQQTSQWVMSGRLNSTNMSRYEDHVVSDTAPLLYYNFLSYNKYPVQFVQSGLPSGSTWYVNFNDEFSSGPITGSTYSVSMANGTYGYSVVTTNIGYQPPPNGNFSVSGKQLSINFAFTSKKAYSVVFSETGLGSNSEWYVNISGLPSSGPLSSSTTTYTTNLFNSTYGLTVVSTNKIYRAVYTGIFRVNGAPLTMPIQFLKVNYSVVFSESGLSAGTVWNVTVNGVKQGSATNSITFQEVNGSYTYSVQGIYGYSGALTGAFTVAGSSLNIPVTYSKNATVHIDVLTSGASLTVDGIPIGYGSGKVVLSLQQGYHFINTSESGYETAADLFYFGPSVYYVNITLVQLITYGYLAGNVIPADAYLSASGISISISNGNYNQSLTPGSYYVSVEAQGYASADYLVNITNGHTTYLNVSLTKVNQSYTVSGTVNPGNSSVMFGPYTAYVNSTGFYTISLPSGSYNYSVTDSGYFPSTGSVDVTSDLAINFVLVQTPPPQSVAVTSSIQASGYNLTVSNLTNGNGNISLTFSANVSGTLVVQIPYSEIQNATISEILNSTVYVNGTSYSNFTIALSSSNGTFSVILTVYGLNGDPLLEWAYLPNVKPPTPPPPIKPQPPKPFSIAWYDYVILLDAIVIVTAYLVGRNISKRKKQGK